jgi:hypothetical protein
LKYRFPDLKSSSLEFDERLSVGRRSFRENEKLSPARALIRLREVAVRALDRIDDVIALCDVTGASLDLLSNVLTGIGLTAIDEKYLAFKFEFGFRTSDTKRIIMFLRSVFLTSVSKN